MQYEDRQAEQAFVKTQFMPSLVSQAFSAQPHQVSLALLLAQPTLQVLPTQQYALLRTALYLFPSYKLHMHNAHGCVVGSLSFNH